MVLGEEHPETLTSMANLAFTWKGQDRHADALALMMECSQVLQQALGPVHPHTRSAMASVAQIMRRMKQTYRLVEYQSRR